MMWIDISTTLLLAVGSVFFLTGTVGLLRFPDLMTRLHALTKADNVGLAFIVLGLSLQSDNLWQVAKLGFIWALVQLASASVAHLIASTALEQAPEKKER
ncbi:MAG TPA: monovalent cation/H(+) antiporter subunit G [Marinagarivorans sp.]